MNAAERITFLSKHIAAKQLHTTPKHKVLYGRPSQLATSTCHQKMNHELKINSNPLQYGYAMNGITSDNLQSLTNEQIIEQLERAAQLQTLASKILLPWSQDNDNHPLGPNTVDFVRKPLLPLGDHPLGFFPRVRVVQVKYDDNKKSYLYQVIVWLKAHSHSEGASSERRYTEEELPKAIKDHQKLVDLYLKTIGDFTLREEDPVEEDPV